MIAQEELAKYLLDDAEARSIPGCAPLYYNRAVQFLHDHGPALAELIDHCMVLKDCRSAMEVLITADLIKSATKKLTEPKA